MTTEELIRRGIGHDAEPGFELPSVENIARSARRRRRTQAGALGALVLLVIVGAGLVLAPDRVDAPSSVFVSEDTEADSDPGGETETEPAAAFTGLRTTRVERSVQSLDTARPTGHLVATDGAGGFVGLRAASPYRVSSGGDESTVVPAYQLAQSDDGEAWVTFGEWEVGGWLISSIDRVGRGYAVLAQAPETDDRGQIDGEALFRYEVAFSDDLIDWEHRPVEIDLRATVEDFAIDLDKVIVRAYPVVSARVGETDVIQIVVSVQVRETVRACGSGSDERGLFEIACDGSIDVVVSREALDALGVDRLRTLTASGDGTFDVVDDDAVWIGASTADGLIRTVGRGGERTGDLVEVSGDGRNWNAVRPVEGAASAARDWAVSEGGGDDQILALGWLPLGSVDQVAVIDRADDQIRVVPLPLLTDETFGIQVGHGPAGWAILATQEHVWAMTDKDWVVQGWDTGAGSVALLITSNDPNRNSWYRLSRDSPLVERGLFGELRIRRPGALEQVLVESSDGDRQLSQTVVAYGPRPADGDRNFELDGWTVTGDASEGPLFVTDPTGRIRSFDDGYAFVNEGLDDGIELVGASRSAPLAGSLRVYDEAGDVAWVGVWRDIVRTLMGSAEFETRVSQSWVLSSVDGVEWKTAWHRVDANLGHRPTVIVGDEEILIQVSEQGVTDRSIVIELDDG